MDREERQEIIRTKCRAHECGKDTALRHFKLFVDDKWDVHPPKDFVAWMEREVECKNRETGDTCIARATYENPITAWNTQAARDEFREHKQYGAV